MNTSEQKVAREQVAQVEKPLSGTGSALVAVRVMQQKTVAIAKDPQVQAIAVSLSGGAVTCGAAGGLLGLASGAAVGGAIGVVPALFTFGLSIPVGAVVGGAVGLVGGTVIGGGTGMLAGGAAGGLSYRYRIEIKDGAVVVYTRTGNACAVVQLKAVTVGSEVKVVLLNRTASSKAKAIESISYTRSKAGDLLQVSKVQASRLRKSSQELVSDRTFQVTAASAAVGGTAMGATGGAVGLTAGAVVGAAIGVVPALFTFGLSIPIGAIIGGSSGLVAGVATGSTIGAVGGGAAGRGVYTKREAIKDGATSALGSASDLSQYVKGKAQDSVSYVQLRVTGGTGGTDTEQ